MKKDNRTEKKPKCTHNRKSADSVSNTAVSKTSRDVMLRILPYLLLLLAFIFLLSLLFPSLLGNVGKAVSRFFPGLFGLPAYLIAVFLGLHAATLNDDIQKKLLPVKIPAAFLFLTMTSVLFYIFSDATTREALITDLGTAYNGGIRFEGGGIIGDYIGEFLRRSLESVGTVLLYIAVLAFFLCSFFGITPKSFAALLKKLLPKTKDGINKPSFRAPLPKARDGLSEDEYCGIRPEPLQPLNRNENGFDVSGDKVGDRTDFPLDNDFFFLGETASGTQSFSIRPDSAEKPFSDLPHSSQKTVASEEKTPCITFVRESMGNAFMEAPVSSQADSVPTRASAFAGVSHTAVQAESESVSPLPSENPAVFGNSYLVRDNTAIINNASYSASVSSYSAPPPTSPKEQAHVSSEASSGGYDFSRYRYPDISFLTPQETPNEEYIIQETETKMQLLVDTLAAYGVVVHPRGYTRGPRVTRYEIVPDQGVRISAITNLQNEIAMNLCAESLMIEAPVPGASVVGIEVPNSKTVPVRLRGLIEIPAFREARSKTTVALGKDISGKPFYANIAEMPHLLVAGATGMGKSVCINSILTSILYKARPDEVRLILVDPKIVEFSIYEGIPHLLVPVIHEAKQAIGALNWAVDEMNRRLTVISKGHARDLETYEISRKRDPSLEVLPRIIIVIDELNDLVLSLKNPRLLDDVVTRLAAKARSTGIHLILGTQRPTVNVITGNIKANINTRIAFHVTSKTDSMTILDTVGAEKLLPKGDMLFAQSTAARRIQGAYVELSEITAITSFLIANMDGADAYDISAMNGINSATASAEQDNGSTPATAPAEGSSHAGSEEALFWDAVYLALGTNKVSTSLLERKLSIGYGRAAKIIDKMEDLGIVTPQNEKKARELIMNLAEVEALKSRLSGRGIVDIEDVSDDPQVFDDEDEDA